MIEQNDFHTFPNLLRKGGFLLCTRGSAELFVNGLQHSFSQGDVMIVTPLVLARLSSEVKPSEDFSYIQFTDDIKTFFDIFNLIADTPIPLAVYREPIWRVTPGEQQYITNQHAHLMRLFDSLTNADTDICRALLNLQIRMLRQEVMLEVVNNHINNVTCIKESSSRESAVYRFLISLHENYHLHRTVKHYADLVNLSTSYFTSIVKQATGQSPSEWIATITISYAKLMLEQRDKNIKQIAEELNFPEQFTFRKYFKQHTGLSPKAYREKMLRAI